MPNLLKSILITVAGILAGVVVGFLALILVGLLLNIPALDSGWGALVAVIATFATVTVWPAAGIYIAWKIAKKRNMVPPTRVKPAAQSSPPGNYLPSDSAATSETSTRKPVAQRPPPGNYLPSDSSATSETSTQGKTNDVTKRKPTQNAAIGCLVIVIAAVAVIVACSIYVTSDSEPSDAEKAEEKRKGFHCLSPWDGNHDGLEALIKTQLKDPDSMETIETRMTPVNANGNHRIFLKYRALNSFGGMVVSQATGSVDNDTCEATLLTNE